MKPRQPSEAVRTTRHRAAGAVCSWAIALAGAILVLPAPAAAASHTITIDAMSFSPQLLEASVGDTVIWTNNDPFPHTATAQDHSFDSGDIQPGESFTFKVSREGEFAYVCTLHPTMKGTLLVKRK